MATKLETSQSTSPKRPMNRLTPIKETMQNIHNYPKTLLIYKTNASRFFWVRFFYNGKYRIKTTKCMSPKDAKAFAVRFYKDTLVSAVLSNTGDKRQSFEVIANQFFKSTERNSNEKTYRSDYNRYKQHILPEFKQQDVETITNAQIHQFVERLRKEGLSPATVKHHLVVLRKILKFAIANDLMKALPVFPRITGRLQTQEKRDYLTNEEYDHLIKCCDSLIAKKITVRGVPLTPEMKFLIQFLVNSFMRPSDLRVLKHKHVVKKTKNGATWIELNHPATKTNAHPIQAMPVSTHIYRRLLEFKDLVRQKAKPDDFVFFPDYKNRDTAMGVIGRLFKEVVTESGLKESSGKSITLYSLRHTATMFRLILGQVDSLALARNARTSQSMIDRFYAAHLTTDQVREQLHALPKRSTTKQSGHSKNHKKSQNR
jgi:integrase